MSFLSGLRGLWNNSSDNHLLNLPLEATFILGIFRLTLPLEDLDLSPLRFGVCAHRLTRFPSWQQIRRYTPRKINTLMGTSKFGREGADKPVMLNEVRRSGINEAPVGCPPADRPLEPGGGPGEPNIWDDCQRVICLALWVKKLQRFLLKTTKLSFFSSL